MKEKIRNISKKNLVAIGLIIFMVIICILVCIFVIVLQSTINRANDKRGQLLFENITQEKEIGDLKQKLNELNSEKELLETQEDIEEVIEEDRVEFISEYDSNGIYPILITSKGLGISFNIPVEFEVGENLVVSNELPTNVSLTFRESKNSDYPGGYDGREISDIGEVKLGGKLIVPEKFSMGEGIGCDDSEAESSYIQFIFVYEVKPNLFADLIVSQTAECNEGLTFEGNADLLDSKLKTNIDLQKSLKILNSTKVLNGN